MWITAAVRRCSTEPAWDPRVLLTLETRMEHEQEADIEAISA